MSIVEQQVGINEAEVSGPDKLKNLVLFDGVCNFCNNSVVFIIKRDAQAKFQFASLQSDVGQLVLKKYNLPSEEYESIVLVNEDKVFTKSTAALRIAKDLNGLWSLFYFFIIVPKPLRDWVYGVVAANRYKWFGKRDACMIPDDSTQTRFLS